LPYSSHPGWLTSPRTNLQSGIRPIIQQEFSSAYGGKHVGWTNPSVVDVTYPSNWCLVRKVKVSNIHGYFTFLLTFLFTLSIPIYMTLFNTLLIHLLNSPVSDLSKSYKSISFTVLFHSLYSPRLSEDWYLRYWPSFVVSSHTHSLSFTLI